MDNQSSAKSLGRPRDPAKVEAILDASWRLFLARGVEAVTVDEIAAEAGVSKGTIYSYFADKHALFQEIFLPSTALWLEARAFLPSALRLFFALPSSLGCLIVTTAASFS